MSETTPDAAARLADIAGLRDMQRSADLGRCAVTPDAHGVYDADAYDTQQAALIAGYDGSLVNEDVCSTEKPHLAILIAMILNALPWLLDAAERGLMAEGEEKHADRD